MKTKTEHTPTQKNINVPWMRTGKIRGEYTISSKLTGELIGLIIRESQTDFIVKAVNSHEALLEALKIAMNVIPDIYAYQRDKIKEIITLAKGE